MAKKISINDYPIKLLFYVFPFISIISFFIGIRIVNYDIFWIAFFLFIIINCRKFKIIKGHYYFLLTILLLTFIKYIIPIPFIKDIYAKALIMDAKWIIYLIISILWVNRFGFPNISVIYKGGIFFAKLYILFSIYIFLVYGFDRRFGILNEANYDGFMILIPFCFIQEMKGTKKEYLIFIIATLCTLSRTGIACLLIITFYQILKTKPYYIIFAFPLLLLAVAGAFMLRGGHSSNNLDRFLFFAQAYMFFSENGLSSICLGSIPGKSLDMSIIPAFQWHIDTFENMHNIKGIFPFYFHSAYLRIALTWGLPITLITITAIILTFFKSPTIGLKKLCILILIQSISLSTLTLANVSILLFLTFLSAIKKRNMFTYNNNKHEISINNKNY